MNDSESEVGLCLTCRHARIVPTPRQSYWLCELSFTDARFAKYPRLPVLACDGYEPKTSENPPSREDEEEPGPRGFGEPG
jgi:hypothetical protein